VRGGRKAAGLSREKMAELPKDESLVCSVFYLKQEGGDSIKKRQYRSIWIFEWERGA
jgi:hypothetical protein